MTKELNCEPTLHCYLKGYWEALSDFGIWKDGQRLIGCMQNDIKEVMKNKLNEFPEIDHDAFWKSLQ